VMMAYLNSEFTWPGSEVFFLSIKRLKTYSKTYILHRSGEKI